MSIEYGKRFRKKKSEDVTSLSSQQASKTSIIGECVLILLYKSSHVVDGVWIYSGKLVNVIFSTRL